MKATQTSEQIEDRSSRQATVLSVKIEEKSFAQGKILGRVNFDATRGECIALTGPSGSGKSTVLRLIAGLDEDYTGDIFRPDKCRVVFQEPNLLPWISVLKNLTVACDITPQEAEAALAQVGLEDHSMHFPTQLSLGQQRRLSLARAFACQPDLLLMDEAFVSLDEALADEMMSLFETLRKRSDVTTLLVTHDRKEAERLADRILRLEGTPSTLVRDDL